MHSNHNQPAKLDFSERSVAESLLGIAYTPRSLRARGRVARGICDVRVGTELYVCTAYSIDGGNVAKGLLCDRTDGSVRLILAPADSLPTQSELAEAVDFWEHDSDCRVFSLYEKSCGAVVYTGDGDERRYLMIRMNLGHCGLPKGHVEKFETEEDAAIREVLEETGVHIRLLPGFRETVEYPISSKTRKLSVYFIGRFDGDSVKIQPSEIRGYKLCPKDEARMFITHDNDRAVFDAALEFLAQNEVAG